MARTTGCERSLTTVILVYLGYIKSNNLKTSYRYTPGNILGVLVPINKNTSDMQLSSSAVKMDAFLYPLCFRDSSVKCVHCYKDGID